MARHKTALQDQFPYHITGRCINKEWFHLHMDTVWKVFCDELHMVHITHNLRIHSFVLMNNHYHLIASTPDANISSCMQQFASRVSYRLTRLGNRINQTFAGRYFKSILFQPNHYLNAYKYNYRNPVTAGMTRFTQDYPYSTLNGLLGGSKLLCPVAYDDTLFSNIDGTLNWLNTNPGADKLAAVKFALSKRRFSPSQNKRSSLFLGKDECI